MALLFNYVDGLTDEDRVFLFEELSDYDEIISGWCRFCGKIIPEECDGGGCNLAPEIKEEKILQSATPTNKSSPKYFEECDKDIDNQSDCDRCFGLGHIECPRYIMQS